MQWYQEKSGGPVRVWSLDSAEHGAFEAWQADVALAADEVGRLAHAESPVKRMKRTATGREHLWWKGESDLNKEPDKKSDWNKTVES